MPPEFSFLNTMKDDFSLVLSMWEGVLGSLLIVLAQAAWLIEPLSCLMSSTTVEERQRGK